MKVMIVVTHLLGTGHLARALTLARAFIAEGHTATVVSGGMPAPMLDRGDVPLIQLPPLRSDGVRFTRLLGVDSAPARAEVFAERLKIMQQQLATHPPDILITELFPFGRRILKDEFTATLKAARALAHPPLILCSVRDILAPPSKPIKAEQTEMIIMDHYDAVLVHSDAELVPLSLSWPVTPRLEPFLKYTGFVAPPPAQPHPDKEGRREIIVSAGGGDVGTHLFEAARDAARADDTLQWRLLIGGAEAKAQTEQINMSAPVNLKAEPARPDFRGMLHHASASVSLCGYNTALDILQVGVPALFVPFDDGGEVEQSVRATALARQSGIDVLTRADLTPESLLAAVQRVMAAPGRAPRSAGFDGARETVRIAVRMKEDRDEG